MIYCYIKTTFQVNKLFFNFVASLFDNKWIGKKKNKLLLEQQMCKIPEEDSDFVTVR